MVIFLQTVPDEIEDLIDVSSVTGWDLLWALLIVVGGVVLSYLVRWPLRRKLTKATDLPPGPIDLLAKLVGWGVITASVIFALPYLGIDVTPMFVLIVVILVILTVSGRGLVENYGAGVVLQAEGHFQPGDQIVTSSEAGKVVEVGSRAVTMETLDGRRFVVPNTVVLSQPVEVLTAHPHRRSELIVGLAYGTDLERARGALMEAARGASGVVHDPAVQVHVSEFDDSSINFLVWFWHSSDLQSGYETTNNVAEAIDKACKENGLTIAFPQRTIWTGSTDIELESGPHRS